MTLPALYTLASQYRALADQLAEADLDAQTVADSIEASGITDDIATKAQGIECIARSAEAHHDAIDAEIKRLGALKKHRAAIAQGLRDYLETHMEGMGISKIECPLYTLKLQNNPASVDVFEPGLLPAEFMRQPEAPPPAPDKKAIAAALKAGTDVPGAKLTQTQRLVVA